MAVQMTKSAEHVEAVIDANSNLPAQLPVVEEASVVAQNNMLAQKEKFELEIRESGIIDRLTNEINICEPQTISKFGLEASTELSKVSDTVLSKYDPTQLNKTSELMNNLAGIMDEIDVTDLAEEDAQKRGFLSSLKRKAKMNIDVFLKKYNTIGDKLERITTELRVYEKEIERSNVDLNNMYNAYVQNYKQLIAYVLAGEDALVQVADYVKELEAQADGNPEAAMELQSVTNAQQLLEQRVQDLRIAQTVALQSVPRLKSMEYTNWNLARKINTSFIITIPMFKSSIAEAVLMKQQKLQGDALQAFDAKTAELYKRNAKLAADNMRNTAKLAGSSAIKVEDVEQTWQVLMQGITDTRQIVQDISKQRELDKVKLEQLNEKYMGQISMSGR